MYQGLAKNTCNVSVMGSIPIVSTVQLIFSWWLTARNRRAFWSIGEKVSYLTVTQKSTERYRHRPLINCVKV